jgi:hypothetical protein
MDVNIGLSIPLSIYFLVIVDLGGNWPQKSLFQNWKRLLGVY